MIQDKKDKKRLVKPAISRKTNESFDLYKFKSLKEFSLLSNVVILCFVSQAKSSWVRC